MTVLVTYMSVTGNTQKVAEAIYEGIVGEKEMMPMDQVKNLDDFDPLFIGFPIYSFDVPPMAKGFINKYAKGKRVALFYTHAASSEPDVMPESVGLVQNIHQKVREAAAGVVLIGTFDCRGVLAENVAQRCLTSDVPLVQMFGKMRDMTLGHPDATELAAAKAFGKEKMERV